MTNTQAVRTITLALVVGFITGAGSVIGLANMMGWF